MKQATLRDLRYNFNHIATLLQSGEEIQITKRNRVVARVLPPEVPQLLPEVLKRNVQMPDFMARLKEMYGDRVMEVTGAELLEEERDRY